MFTIVWRHVLPKNELLRAMTYLPLAPAGAAPAAVEAIEPPDPSSAAATTRPDNLVNQCLFT
jgi:hypothetical protein